jgi:plastocyanin
VLALAALALTIAATSCIAESEPFDPKPGPTVSIAMTVGAFRPAVDTAEVGSRVIWENQSDQSHTVTADEGAFDSGAVGVGNTFSRPLIEPGTITYRCNFHRGMTGTLVVRARGAAGR